MILTLERNEKKSKTIVKKQILLEDFTLNYMGIFQ